MRVRGAGEQGRGKTEEELAPALEVERALVLGEVQLDRQRHGASVFKGGWHGKFMGRMVGAHTFDFAEPYVSWNSLAMSQASLSPRQGA